MLKQLKKYLKEKKYFVFDFDRTLAKMEIDWTNWHSGIAEVYSKYDLNHGYKYGKNPHKYHNTLVEKYGEPLLQDVRRFSKEYEAEHLTGFTPNIKLIQFIQSNSTPVYYAFSSNSRPTVIRGLKEIGVLDKIKTIVSKDDVLFVKPNPEGFSLLEGFCGNESMFLMIGDSNVDKQAAKRAGVDFLQCNLFEKYSEKE